MAELEKMKQQGVQQQMEIRYVLFSDELGVYLGDDHWSLKDPSGVAGAPTFRLQDEVPQLAGARLVVVWPDLPGHLASPEACGRSLLPRW